MKPTTLNFILFLVTGCIQLAWILADSEDYYKLLGLDKGADNKEIRRSFKKLAMKYHPDKNKEDEKAHDKFVKINRAYEVLKDEEMRKKYDLHGEAGLKDDFQGGHWGQQQHRSWQFFQNFGIYDEDKEIVTLSRADFEQSVASSNGYWFVNYYSPACSHCHQLAPAWRELAREFEGVIRIGAVNCEEEFYLCQEQGIHGYPSLVFYQFPQRVRYGGSREKDDMVNFVMLNIKGTILRIHEKNFKSLTEEWEPYKDMPWLIDFTDESESESGLSQLSRKKLSVMLEGLANVGTVSCHESPSICDSLDKYSGVAFYRPAEVNKENAKELESLDAHELMKSVLNLLPDVKEFTPESFEETHEKILSFEEQPWLIEFIDAKTEVDLDMKKLPAIVKETKIGRLNCTKYMEKCHNLHIYKYPTFAVFKATGGYEIHHGRLSAYDVAGFAKDCAATNVRSLSPEDFPNLVSVGGEPWFVDFFAPWCPPCMKLLPEFRKAAKLMGEEVRFGTVDCTIHQTLCQSKNVHTYPTTIFYNQSQPNVFVGLHSVDELVNFVEDVRNPPVVVLTPETFKKHVFERQKDEIWLVDFFAPWCGPCQELGPEWRALAKMLKDVKGVGGVGSVDCQMYPGFCREHNVQSYPLIRLYPTGDEAPVAYNSWFRNAASIRQWLQEFLPSTVSTLSTSHYYSLLNEEQPWLIDFYAPWCGHCQHFAPVFERIAQKLEGRVKCGKINCDAHPQVCQAASVRAYPTLRFYRGSTGDGLSQNAHGMDIQSQHEGIILNMVEESLPDSFRFGGHDEL